MIHYAIFCTVLWAIICRARLMSHETPIRARLQHWLAALLAGMSLPVVASKFGLENHTVEIMGCALCVYILTDARRWKITNHDARTNCKSHWM